MVGWHRQLIGHESEQTLGDSEGQGSLACWSSQGQTQFRDWATTITNPHNSPKSHRIFSFFPNKSKVERVGMGRGHTAPVPSGARVSKTHQLLKAVLVPGEHVWGILLPSQMTTSLGVKNMPLNLNPITMEVSALGSASEHVLPPRFSEAQCLCCNPSSVCLLKVWMEIVHLFLRFHLSLTVSLSDLFHHEVSVTVRSFTSSLGCDQERHEAWYSRMCVSWPWSLDFWGPHL